MTNYSTNHLFVHFFKRKSVIIVMTLLIVAASLVVYEVTKKPVTLYANGEVMQFATHARTVKDVLIDEQLDVSRFDEIQPALNTAITPNMTIKWQQAHEVVISVDQKRTIIWTTEDVVGEILAQANIDVTEHDVVSHDLEAVLDGERKIKIQKAFEVTLTDGDVSEKFWSTPTSVNNLLAQRGVQIEALDRVEADLGSKVTPGQEIEIIRVQKVTDVVEDSIDFDVEMKEDASLLKGYEKVTQEGRRGKIARTYEVTQENGQETARLLKEKKVVLEPVKKIITIGTKVEAAPVTSQNRTRTAATPTAAAQISQTATAPAATQSESQTATAPAVTQSESQTATAPAVSQSELQTVTAPAVAVQNEVQTVVTPVVTEEIQTTVPAVTYVETISGEPEGGRELYVQATAYTATCKGCSGITKTGINLLVNPHLKVIAVDPKVIPLGSNVWVEGYGHAVAGDIGGAIKGNKIDLFMPRIEDAYAWGRRTVRMKVLN